MKGPPMSDNIKITAIVCSTIVVIASVLALAKVTISRDSQPSVEVQKYKACINKDRKHEWCVDLPK